MFLFICVVLFLSNKSYNHFSCINECKMSFGHMPFHGHSEAVFWLMTVISLQKDKKDLRSKCNTHFVLPNGWCENPFKLFSNDEIEQGMTRLSSILATPQWYSMRHGALRTIYSGIAIAIKNASRWVFCGILRIWI